MDTASPSSDVSPARYWSSISASSFVFSATFCSSASRRLFICVRRSSSRYRFCISRFAFSKFSGLPLAISCFSFCCSLSSIWPPRSSRWRAGGPRMITFCCDRCWIPCVASRLYASCILSQSHGSYLFVQVPLIDN
uniref:Uncharacterized protein n=1 Tax=Anopheles merus TaxID=30066 RepID=A0A182V936_ANOME